MEVVIIVLDTWSEYGLDDAMKYLFKLVGK